MSDSDRDYIGDDLSDEDYGTRKPSRYGTRASGSAQDGRPTGGSAKKRKDPNSSISDNKGTTSRRRAAWEDIQRSWDSVVEGADGSIDSIVEGIKEAGMRKRSGKGSPNSSLS